MRRNKNIQNAEFERLDWELFNLLEGNLSAEEEAQLMAQIEADTATSEYWEGLQKTILPNEPIVYKNKSSLYKKEVAPTILLNWWQKPIGIAASIAIILMLAIPVYHFAVKTDPTWVVSNVHQTTPINTPSKTDIADASNPNSAKSTITENIPNNIKTTLPKRILLSSITQPSHSNLDTIHSNTELNNWVSIPEDYIQTPSFNQILVPKIGELQFAEVSYLPLVRPVSSKDRTFINQLIFDSNQQEYTGLRNAVNQTLATLAEPIRSTSIKFRKIGVKGDPGFKIEVRTEQYLAIASVHLLPKINR